MARKPDENAESRGFGAGYAIVAAGFQLAFAIVLFLGAGVLVDRWLNTKPVFTIIGVLVGLGAGMYAFLRQVMAETPRGADRSPGEPHEPGSDGGRRR